MSEVKLILHKSYKKLAIKAAQMAIESPGFRDELVALALRNEMPFSSRSAWALLSIAEHNPDLAIPYVATVLNKLDSIENHTQIASLLRFFDALDMDLDECGQLFDFCIHMIRIPLEREYSRALAMNLLVKFGKAYPELIPEIKEQISLAAPNFEANHAKRKAKQVLRELSR